LDFNDYQVAAMRTRPKDLWPSQFLQAGIGMAEEACEVLGLVKKVHFHGHDIDTKKLKEELGDTMWHIALMCELLGIGMAEVAEGNIEKLKQRYPGPEGFSEERSRNRGY